MPKEQIKKMEKEMVNKLKSKKVQIKKIPTANLLENLINLELHKNLKTQKEENKLQIDMPKSSLPKVKNK